VTTFSETRRQTVHMSMAAFALLLRVLTWWQAAICAFAALLFNVFLLPRLGGPSLYRPVDTARGYPLGIVIYPLSVLLLILAFPRRLDIVAAAWGILAIGDGAATLVGRRRGGPRLSWNPDKTVAGTIAFIVFGSVAGMLLAWWTRPAVQPPPPLAFILLAPILAALVAGLVETMPTRLDDNISVPTMAGAVFWGLSLATAQAWGVAWPAVVTALLPAVIINAVVATLGWRARTVSTSGAIVGALIGFAVYACTGLGGWLLLFASFAAATASSRIGLTRKALLGIAEEREGRRGPGNAIANCIVGVAAGILSVVSPFRGMALLGFVAALAAGGSDTVASEIGKAWGRRTFLIPTFVRVRPGTSGAVSLEGTAAGLVAALGLSALGLAFGLIPGGLFWFAVIGATAGAFVESWLAATLEAPGILNNDQLNFVNTAVAAIVAATLAKAFS